MLTLCSNLGAKGLQGTLEPERWRFPPSLKNLNLSYNEGLSGRLPGWAPSPLLQIAFLDGLYLEGLWRLLLGVEGRVTK